VQWPKGPFPYGDRRPLMKSNKKFALQLQKQNIYSFELCTVDKMSDLGMIMLDRLSLH